MSLKASWNMSSTSRLLMNIDAQAVLFTSSIQVFKYSSVQEFKISKTGEASFQMLPTVNK